MLLRFAREGLWNTLMDWNLLFRILFDIERKYYELLNLKLDIFKMAKKRFF